MSHGQDTYTKEDIQKIIDAGPLTVPKFTFVALGLLMVVGVLSFISEYIASGEGRTHAWMAVHVNFMYWFGLAAASSGFAAVFHICNAQWVRPIRRIFESAIPFFVISPFFLLFMYFGASDVYEWARHPIAGKANWLQPGFLYTRDFFAAVFLVWIISRVVKGYLVMDFTAMSRGLVNISQGNQNYARWIENKSCSSCCCVDQSGTPETAIRKTYNRMGRYSPLCVMAFALCMSLIAFDILMSVDPHWYSTMFGGFYFMSSVYLAVAFTAIGVNISLAGSQLFREAIKKKTLHDLGKLLFGFGIFWAYLFWSHYLPIWYGNMPEETAYIIIRMREYPWRNIAWIVLGMCFVTPFILGISRDVKQIPGLLALTGIIVACGLWLQYYLLFAPTIYPSYISINLNDIGIGLGFLGLYGTLAISYLQRVPLIPFGDLLMAEE